MRGIGMRDHGDDRHTDDDLVSVEKVEAEEAHDHEDYTCGQPAF